MTTLSNIITQLSVSQTNFTEAIRQKLVALKSSLDANASLISAIGNRNANNGYVGINASGDSTLLRDGTITRDLVVGRNLTIQTGTLNLPAGSTINIGGAPASIGDDISIVMAIALG